MIKKLISIYHDRRFATTRERVKISFFIVIIYTILSLLHIGCPIRFTTGISCPGCGMTRAILSLLSLDFQLAFYYHPLFVITPFMLYLFLFEDFTKPIVLKVSWTVIIISFIVVYFLRILVLHSSVVSIDISDSIMVKLFHYMFAGGYQWLNRGTFGHFYFLIL